MGTPEQPAKKRRSIRPYLRTSTGKFDLTYLIAGIGCILWAPVEIFVFRSSIKDPAFAALLVLGIVVIALSVSNLRRNMTIKR